MSKLRIWVVDDSLEQRTTVIAALIRTQIDLTDETRIDLVKNIFEIVEFDSARKAEEALYECIQDTLPDFIISDNDFSGVGEANPEDNDPDRGLRFLELVNRKHPEIPIALVTSNDIGSYWLRINALARSTNPANLEDALYFIRKGALTDPYGMVRVLQNIFNQKLKLLNEQSRRQIRMAMDSGISLENMMLLKVTVKNRTYFLSSLLGSMAEIVIVDHQPAICYIEKEVRLQLDSIQLVQAPKIPYILNGQLSQKSKTDVDDQQKKSLILRVKEHLLLERQNITISNLIPESEGAIRVFFSNFKQWLEISSPADMDVTMQKALIYNKLDLADLKILWEGSRLPSFLELSGEQDLELFNHNWKNIVRARLVILGIYALRQRQAVLSQLPFSLDFAVHVILRNDPQSFLFVLYKRLPDIPRIANGSDPRATTRQYFNGLCGLSGGFSENFKIDKDREEIRPEHIDITASLFEAERDWYYQIVQGSRLMNLPD